MNLNPELTLTIFVPFKQTQVNVPQVFQVFHEGKIHLLTGKNGKWSHKYRNFGLYLWIDFHRHKQPESCVRV